MRTTHARARVHARTRARVHARTHAHTLSHTHTRLRGTNTQQFGWYGNRREQRTREASVDVKADWTMLEEIEFSRLARLAMDVGTPTDVLTCGQIERYDKAYDRVNTKMPRALQQFNKVFHNVTTTDDPIIRTVWPFNSSLSVGCVPRLHCFLCLLILLPQ